MRLWSIHPRYLDTKGLLAVWREGLLAKKVLEGKTRGYTRHPQLLRFRASKYPERAISSYLHFIWKEAQRRGYSFDAQKIGFVGRISKIPVTRGQIAYERRWLCRKLKVRDPGRCRKLERAGRVVAHPLFKTVPGAGIEPWEKRSAEDQT